LRASGSLIENAPAVEHCLAVGLLAFAVSGCGDDGGPKAPKGVKQSVFERQLKDAQRVSAGDFAPAGEKTLQQLAATAKGGPQAGLATSVFAKILLRGGEVDTGSEFNSYQEIAWGSR